MSQYRRAEEFFEGIDGAVQELENQEGLDFRRRSQEEEEVRMPETEKEGRRVGIGQIDEVRTRKRMLKVEGQ